MSNIKIFRKNDKVQIVLRTDTSFGGSADGEFVAENGTDSDQVTLKRSADNVVIFRDIPYGEIHDGDADTDIAASRDATVTTLNDDYLDRPDPIELKTKVRAAVGGISKGDLITIQGFNEPGLPNVFTAANDTPTPRVAAGMALQDMDSGDIGQMLVVGTIRGIDTSAMTVGARLYLGSAGAFTTTEPAGSPTVFKQSIGFVTRVDATDGEAIINVEPTIDRGTERVVEKVHNGGVGGLLKGTPVHITGENLLGISTVEIARADTAANMPANLVLLEDIAAGSSGDAIMLGLIEDVNTSGFSSGDLLYVGATGGYTTTRPTGTNKVQSIGVVGHIDATNGTAFVTGANRNNDLPNLSEGKYWVGDSNGVPQESSTLRQVYSLNFLDDLGTTKHYMPFKDINEQTTIYQEEAAFVMPYDGRVASIDVRPSQINASGNMTVDVSTLPIGTGIFSSSLWTQQESETLAYVSGDTNHLFHFVFDDAKHFDAGEAISLGIQNSVDAGAFTYFYVTVILEFDTSENLGSSSTEYSSQP